MTKHSMFSVSCFIFTVMSSSQVTKTLRKSANLGSSISQTQRMWLQMTCKILFFFLVKSHKESHKNAPGSSFHGAHGRFSFGQIKAHKKNPIPLGFRESCTFGFYSLTYSRCPGFYWWQWSATQLSIQLLLRLMDSWSKTSSEGRTANYAGVIFFSVSAPCLRKKGVVCQNWAGRIVSVSSPNSKLIGLCYEMIIEWIWSWGLFILSPSVPD